MTEINLLPWREKKREQEKKLFLILVVAGLVCAGIIAFLINSYAVHLVDNQNGRNQLLQKEINSLNEQIKEIQMLKKVRTSLISRMAIIKNLQSTRTVMVHLFDELIKVMPTGVYVYKLERKTDQVTLWGYAESNTNVSLLMTNIESSVWLHSPVLTEIKKMTDSTKAANNDFSLSFILKPKSQTGSAQ